MDVAARFTNSRKSPVLPLGWVFCPALDGGSGTEKPPGPGGLRARGGGVHMDAAEPGDRSPDQRIERQHSEEDAAQGQAEQT